MANIKDSELEKDKLVEGNELIVSTDGDGKTRNILSNDLAEFAAKKAETNIAPSIKANSDKIEEINSKNAQLAAKDEELAAKDAALEAKDAELEAKDAELEAKDAKLEAKDAEIEKNVSDISDKVKELETKADDTTNITDGIKSQINELENKHNNDITTVNNTVDEVKSSVESLQTKHDKDIEKLLAAHDNPWEDFSIVSKG